MSGVQEEFAGYTVTFKFGGGFPAPWLVVRANDEDDLGGKLEALKKSGTGELIAELAKAFDGLYLDDAKPAKKTSSRRDDEDEDEEEERPTRRTTRGSSNRSSSRGGSTNRRPSDDEDEEHPEGEGCKHGVYVKRSGKNQNTGKRWSGWFCPEKSKNCDPIWGD